MTYFILVIITAIYNPALDTVNVTSTNSDAKYATYEGCLTNHRLLKPRERETPMCIPVNVPNQSK